MSETPSGSDGRDLPGAVGATAEWATEIAREATATVTFPSVPHPPRQPAPAKLGPSQRKAEAEMSSERADQRDDESLSFSMVDEAAENLQEIKARTMYRMLEEIDTGTSVKKLLFLTNAQADLLASTPGSVAKLLDAFEFPKPKLMIDFLKSCGSPAWYEKVLKTQRPDCSKGPHWFANGLMNNAPPFEDQQAFVQAQERLVTFMKEVVIPLAVETNAVVIGSANQNECWLTTAFQDAYYFEKQKWGNTSPFTFIGSTCELSHFYTLEDESALWKIMRRKSMHWRMRDKRIVEMWHAQNMQESTLFDLDDKCEKFIIVDSIDEKKNRINIKSSWGRLMTAITSHLAEGIPSVSFKTGHSFNNPMNTPVLSSALDHAVNKAKSGTPVVLLDLRMRQPIPVVQAQTRRSVIEAAKDRVEQMQQRLAAMDPPRSDCLDVCLIAYFKDVLFGDGNAETTATLDSGPLSTGPEHRPRKTLSAVIRSQIAGEKQAIDGSNLPRANSEEVDSLVSWLSNSVYRGYHLTLPEKFRTSDDPLQHYRDMHYKFGLLLQALFNEDRVHPLNVLDIPGSKRLVGELVKLDRLPKYETIEGLYLLRDAWDEFDVCMALGSHYKTLSKVTYALLLLLGIATVSCTVFQVMSLNNSGPSEGLCQSLSNGSLTAEMLVQLDLSVDISQCDPPVGGALPASTQLGHAIFLLSLASSLLLSVIGFVNPSSRWRQLRASALSLESLIWQYRARVGPCIQSAYNARAPEEAFCALLQAWREELVAGTDLQSTTLERAQNPSVYKHHQHSSLEYVANGDDFHSPVKPEAYIELRLLPAKRFYQSRIPRRVRWRFTLQVLVFLCSATSAALAYFEFPSYVAIISALAAAVTSWTEFTDAGRKIERYSAAVRSIKNVHSWWLSISEVEKASSESIARLLLTGEGIITNEHRAWQSTASAKAKEKNEGWEGGKERNKEKEKDK